MRAGGLARGVSGGAPEHPGEERHRIDVEGTRDCNELCHIDAPLEGFDPLDPVGWNLELASELSLGDPCVSAGGRDGRGDSPMSTGILHSRALGFPQKALQLPYHRV